MGKGRGWTVVNKRINSSRRTCPICGRRTYIYTRARGRFCYTCNYGYDFNDSDLLYDGGLKKMVGNWDKKDASEFRERIWAWKYSKTGEK